MSLIRIIVFISISKFSISQEIIFNEKLEITDTTLYNGDSILVFNDKSWEYLSEFHIKQSLTTTITNGCLEFDSKELFNYNWKNFKTYSLDFNLKGLVDSIKINTKGFIKPSVHECNSTFKIRGGKWHQGNDFASPTGSEVKASWGGKVRYAQMNYGGYGNLVIIRHYNGLETYYAHLSKINVKINDVVSAGEIIGKVGNTGHSSGPHLHFEIRFLDNPIDPEDVYNRDYIVIQSGLFKSMRSTSERFKFMDLVNISATVEEIRKTTINEEYVKTRRGRKTSSNL